MLEAHRLGAFDGATQDVAGVALVGGALRGLDVAEHPRDPLFGRAPRQDPEGGRVRHRDHVGLLDRVEAGDRRSVEAHPPFKGVGELGGVDREGLELTEDVGEPEAYEADVTLPGEGDDFLRVLRGGLDPGRLLGAHRSRNPTL